MRTFGDKIPKSIVPQGSLFPVPPNKLNDEAVLVELISS
jgi:hypothetical protein